MDGIVCLDRTRQIGLPCDAPYAPYPGTRAPRSRCHNAMIPMGDGGPARTRTCYQGIMSTLVSLGRLEQAEETETLFR